MLHIWGGNKNEAVARSLTTQKNELIFMLFLLLKVFLVLMNYEHFCLIYFVLETITSAHNVETLYLIMWSGFSEVNFTKESRESFIAACAWLGRRGPIKFYPVFVVEIKFLFSAV